MTTILEKSGFNLDRKLKIVGTSPVKHDGIDKVTGRAKFGADLFLPGMLVGKILRSPHPHARIKSIDISAAERLPGVKAVVTRDDFPELKIGTPAGDMTRNAMAREKALYDGHPVAAVAATSEAIAKQALKLIKVDYEVLPHVIDPVEAMQPGAPILHEHLRTKGVKGADQPTNVVERLDLGMGDVAKGFAEADIVVEREYDTKPMHQGYIEPQGCVATSTEDGQIELWCCTQGPWVFRDRLSEILKIDSARIRVTQSELGGGFGGKTGFYAEPVAIVLARKAKRPVKIALTRNEVFRATGPVSGTRSRVKMGVTKDGIITAAEAELIFQTGAFTGSMFSNAPQAMFTRYDLKNIKTVSYEVVSNRPKVNSFRAPCVPQVVFGVEGVIDELARKIGMDPIDLRLKNAAKEGYKTIYGETFGPIGFVETLQAAKACDHYRSPVPPGQGRGVAAGFWFNRGGETTGTLNIAPDGSVTIILGTSDVAGSRISISMMAAEELGIPVDKVRAIMADTHSLGSNRVTAGSRTTFASGMVIIDSARKAITELLPPRRRHLGRARGSRRLRGRLLPAGQLQCRHLRAAVDRADREQDHGQPRRHRRPLRDERDRRGSGLRPPHRRRRGRPRDRPRRCEALYGGRGRRQGDPSRSRSKASTRAAPCRASAGRSTRSTTTATTAACRTRASSTIACRWRRTFR